MRQGRIVTRVRVIAEREAHVLLRGGEPTVPAATEYVTYGPLGMFGLLFSDSYPATSPDDNDRRTP